MAKPVKYTNRPGADQHRFRPDVVWTLTVTDSDTAKSADAEKGLTLIEFLLDRLKDQKRTSIKEMLRHTQVLVNGQPESNALRVMESGDVVKVNFTREFKVFYHRRLKLVYEDDDIIVVNKGYGLLSMGNDNEREETAYNIIRNYLKWHDPRNKVFIVHRLDRDTSGLMMFAKTVEAKEAMQHNWNNMVLERRYVALVEGTPSPAEGAIRNYLLENSRYEVYSSDSPESGGQLAVTRYRTLRSGHGFSLMELQLDTGRKNQIRVHMKDLGHPIAGDRRYGSSCSPIHRLALHAQTLRFVHPVTRRDMNFATPVPKAFLSVL